MRKNHFGDRQRKLRCALCWHTVLSRLDIMMKLIHFNFSDTSATSMLKTQLCRYAVLADVSNGVPLIYLRWKYGKSHSTNAAATSPDRTELLLERRDKPRAGPDILPTTPHYRDICHRRRYIVHRLHRHLRLSLWRSVADVPADTVARHGPVHSSQSIESRSHYRSPNNHVLRSLAGRVRDVRGPAKQI